MTSRPFRSAAPKVEKGLQVRDLPLDGEGALYGQIYRSLRAAILDGRVAPGMQLPTTRSLARELGISRNTVISAFEPLRAEGYIHTRVGSGTFVARQVDARPLRAVRGQALNSAADVASQAPRLSRYGQRLAKDSPRRLHDAFLSLPDLPFDFRPCVPDLDRLPDDTWRRTLIRTANYLPSSEFDYADPAGSLVLREAVASYLGRARSIRCDAKQIVIVGGVAQALDLATRLIVDPGDPVLIEDPHYLGARRVLRAGGAEIVGAPVDAEGIDLEGLSTEVRERAKLAYVTPSHQFPTGAVMSLSRRLELLRWAAGSNAFVIEDDYDSEFRYSGRAIEALKSLDDQGRVLYVGTFSKTLLPSLRIAYLVLPESMVELFRNAKWLSDWAAPIFEQHALGGFLQSGDFERHLRRARTLYSESRQALLEAMQHELEDFGIEFFDSQAGLHLLARFPAIESPPLGPFVAEGHRRGLGLYPSAPCYLQGTAAKEGAALELILGFARLAPDSIRQGTRVLRSLLEEVRAGDVCSFAG